VDALTWVNTALLGIIVVLGWLKLANGDESEGCCAVILLCLFLGMSVLGVAIWGLGSLIGWW
jgi:hypothetical protein